MIKGLKRMRVFSFLLVLMFVVSGQAMALTSSKTSVKKASSPVMKFPDKNFERAVRDYFNKPKGDILLSDVTKIRELDLVGYKISNLEGIQYFSNLELLGASDNNIASIDLLKNLKKLSLIDIKNNKVSSLAPIKGLVNLRFLNFRNNNINNIDALKNLTKIFYLDMAHNKISNINIISNLKSLQTLDISFNQIGDISPITNLKHVQELSLHNNKISDISSLAGHEYLSKVTLENNNITDFGPLTEYLETNSITLEDFMKVLNLQEVEGMKADGDVYSKVIKVKRGIKYTAPDTVNITLKDGTKQTVVVNWNKKEIETNSIDPTIKCEVQGRLEGYKIPLISIQLVLDK